MQLGWESLRIISTEPWVQSLVPHRQGVVAYTCHPREGRRQEDHKFKEILSYSQGQPGLQDSL